MKFVSFWARFNSVVRFFRGRRENHGQEDTVFTHRSGDPVEGDNTETISYKRGCCFWIPCFGSDRSKRSFSVWEKIRVSENNQRWWMRSWKKVREWSEIVAGPRWKTFIRKFSRGRGGRHNKFQYDPLSYALNFDDGDGDSESDNGFRDFSSRYALPPSAKSSMDLGKDGPIFIQIGSTSGGS